MNIEEILKQIVRDALREYLPIIAAEIARQMKSAATEPPAALATRWHSEAETAALLGKSRESVQRYRRSGLLKSARHGKTPVYSDAHIADFRDRTDTMPVAKRQQSLNKLKLVA